jgi:hypothetical protein
LQKSEHQLRQSQYRAQHSTPPTVAIDISRQQTLKNEQGHSLRNCLK